MTVFSTMPEILRNFIIPISFSLLQILVVCKYHNLRIKHINIYSHALSLNYVNVIKRTMFVLNSKSLHALLCKLSFSKYPFQKYNYDFFFIQRNPIEYFCFQSILINLQYRVYLICSISLYFIEKIFNIFYFTK